MATCFRQRYSTWQPYLLLSVQNYRINLHLIMTQKQEINLWGSTCLKIYIYIYIYIYAEVIHRSLMDSGNNSARSFLLSAYFCIHIQSCVIYVNHSQVLHEYQNQHAYELKWNKGQECSKGSWTVSRDEDGVDPWTFCGPSNDSAENSIIDRHFYIAKDLLVL